jgi:hypothetical protein
MQKNARLIAVERDTEGIRLAAVEMLTESLYVEERKRTLRAIEQSADPAAALKTAALDRKFACGYYIWVAYLFGIEDRIQAGISVELTAADATGLLALREARRQFDTEYPQCRCGRRMKNVAEKAQGMCTACKEASV